MDLSTLRLWLQQPTSVAGISVISGAVSAVAAGHLSPGGAIGFIVFGFVAIAMKDNSAQQAQVEQIGASIVNTLLAGPAAAVAENAAAPRYTEATKGPGVSSDLAKPADSITDPRNAPHAIEG